MKTRITELLHIEYPIIQGGLAHLAFSGLAAAVSNAGGLGQITATSLSSTSDLELEISKARELTDKPFGVNIAIGQHKSVDALVDVVIEQKISVVTLTGGNPEPIIKRLEGHDIRKLVLVSSVRQAQKAEALGADAVIAVGQEGGGHIGRDDTGTFVLVPRVVDAVRIPVVASGGIADGRGLLAALALGADGIEMGTRFVATEESIASAEYKERLVKGTELDTRVIKRSIGAPGRVINGAFAEEILNREADGITPEDLYGLTMGERNKRAVYAGDFDNGYAWAGQSTGLIYSIPTVQALISDIISTAVQCRDRMIGAFNSD
ncbi:NAD(P)H-dependent flavin oxidoreductase [Alicyclobacillus dauci]|uniref:Probable nitronate monooxygenase n=1 Tax=Alicyclobacillus dauci TaxID=1475485 RepID=A0ABY6Z4X6_9BACL|nr:nitronate monooxygenase [Alicyclobacillus dauci]WAH37906.1 nitronate monooxygenase [Alicyclobacillus dauci]